MVGEILKVDFVETIQNGRTMRGHPPAYPNEIAISKCAYCNLLVNALLGFVPFFACAAFDMG